MVSGLRQVMFFCLSETALPKLNVLRESCRHSYIICTTMWIHPKSQLCTHSMHPLVPHQPGTYCPGAPWCINFRVRQTPEVCGKEDLIVWFHIHYFPIADIVLWKRLPTTLDNKGSFERIVDERQNICRTHCGRILLLTPSLPQWYEVVRRFHIQLASIRWPKESRRIDALAFCNEIKVTVGFTAKQALIAITLHTIHQ